MTAPSPDRRAIITEALRKIDDLNARLAIAEKASTEPIAVVGIGCRLPGGVSNAEEFWTLLQEGASGVIRVPADRWDADAYYSDDHTVPGTICNRTGGFLTSWQPDEFVAEFFNIAPREAVPGLQSAKRRLASRLDRFALDTTGADDALESAIANAELAGRMQAAVPEPRPQQLQGAHVGVGVEAGGGGQ